MFVLAGRATYLACSSSRITFPNHVLPGMRGSHPPFRSLFQLPPSPIRTSPIRNAGSASGYPHSATQCKPETCFWVTARVQMSCCDFSRRERRKEQCSSFHLAMSILQARDMGDSIIGKGLGEMRARELFVPLFPRLRRKRMRMIIWVTCCTQRWSRWTEGGEDLRTRRRSMRFFNLCLARHSALLVQNCYPYMSLLLTPLHDGCGPD